MFSVGENKIERPWCRRIIHKSWKTTPKSQRNKTKFSSQVHNKDEKKERDRERESKFTKPDDCGSTNLHPLDLHVPYSQHTVVRASEELVSAPGIHKALNFFSAKQNQHISGSLTSDHTVKFKCS